MPYFDPMYFVMLAPALLLGLWAQYKVHASYSEGDRMPARLNGAQAARRMLDSVGLYDVSIEQVAGHLSDHYDPRAKVLRLSPNVFHGHSLSAVGIAAHEAGHAIQDASHYAPLVVRNAAVGVAGFGGGVSSILILVGLLMSASSVVWLGIAAFGAVVFFELVNLPVEFDASARAKQYLVSMGIVSQEERYYVSKVLNAAAWTYVAKTLQSVLTLAYFVMRFGGSRDDSES